MLQYYKYFCVAFVLVLIGNIGFIFFRRENIKKFDNLISTIYECSGSFVVFIVSGAPILCILMEIPYAFISSLNKEIKNKTLQKIDNVYWDWVFGVAIFIVVVAVILFVLTMVILSGITVPMINYILSLKEVYGNKKIGRIYIGIWRIVGSVIPLGLFLVSILLLFPEPRGRIVFGDNLNKNCLDVLMKNGYIQSGTGAFATDKGFYKNNIRVKEKKKKKYQIVRVGRKNLNILKNVKTELPDFVYLDGKLIGVTDDRIIISSLSGNTYRMIEFDWKKEIIQKGQADYKKIQKILEKQKKQRISVKEAACVIGAMQDGYLIGFDEQCNLFMKEEKQDGIHFVKYGKEKIKDYGLFDVMRNKTILYTYINNSIWYINHENVLCQMDLNKGEKILYEYKNEKMIVAEFSYYNKGGEAYIIAANHKVLYTINGKNHFCETREIDLSEVIIRKVYCSQDMVCICDNNGKTYTFVDEDYYSTDIPTELILNAAERVISVKKKVMHCKESITAYIQKEFLR